MLLVENNHVNWSIGGSAADTCEAVLVGVVWIQCCCHCFSKDGQRGKVFTVDLRTMRVGEGFVPWRGMRACMHAFSHSPVVEEEKRHRDRERE